MREAQGDKELGRQSRCKDKLRATRAGAYIRASRAPQDLEAQGGKLGRQSRCMDKLRATGADAYIRASRAPQDFEGGAGG